MMKDKKNIDDIFRNASIAYSAATPSNAWEKIDAALKTKRRRRLIFWISFSSFSLFLILFSIFIFSDFDYQIKSLMPNNSKVQLIEKQKYNSRKAVDSSTTTLQNFEKPSSENSLTISKINQNSNPISKAKKLSKKLEIPSEPNYNVSKNKNQSELQEPTSISTKSIQNNNIIESHRLKLNIENAEINSKVLVSPAELVKADILLSKIEDSIISTTKIDDNLQPNSALSRDSIAKTNKLKDRFIPEFVISSNIAFGFTSKISQAPKLTEFTSTSTTNEKYGKVPVFGLNIGIYFTKNLSLSLGIQHFNLITNGEFQIPQNNVRYVNVDNFGYTTAGIYSVQNIETLYNTRSYNPMDYLSKLSKITQSISMIEIPISLGYHWNLNNWKFNATTGFSFGKIVDNQIKIGDEKSWLLNGKLKSIKTSISGINFGGEVFFARKKGLNLGIKSDLIMYLNSVSMSSDFSHKPFIFYIGPQLNYWF